MAYSIIIIALISIVCLEEPNSKAILNHLKNQNVRNANFIFIQQFDNTTTLGI